MQDDSFQLRVRVLGAISGMLSPIVAVIAISYAISSNANFSFASNALSDLGASAIMSPFNIGMVISGMLLAIFFISLFYLLPKVRLYCALGAIGAISLELLGIFNETYPIHLFFSTVYFLVVPLAIVGINAYSPKMPYALKNYGIVSGIVSVSLALFGMEFMSLERSYGIGFAVNEALGAALLSIWLMIFALMVLTGRYKAK